MHKTQNLAQADTEWGFIKKIKKAANSVANAVEDAVDYVGDGDNWEAIGKTLGGGALELIKGDFDSAVDIWGDEDLYSGDTWDEMEE